MVRLVFRLTILLWKKVAKLSQMSQSCQQMMSQEAMPGEGCHMPAIQHLLFLTVSVDTWHDKSCVLLLLLLCL